MKIGVVLRVLGQGMVRFLAAFLLVFTVAACDSPEERLQAHYEEGEELLEAGDLVKADVEFRNALQINSDHVPSLMGLVEIRESQAEWQAVAQLLKRVLELDPEHVDANVRFGRIVLLSGRVEEALEYSNIAYRLAPEDPQVLAFRAGVLLHLEDTKGAIDTAKQALKIDPKNVEAMSVLAAERISAGKVREAIEILDQGLKGREDNVTLQLIRLQSLASLNERDKIEETLQALIGFYPQARPFKTALVNFYVEVGRLDDAETVLRQEAEDNPDDLQANLALIRFLASQRGSDAAEAELRSLIADGGEFAQNYRLGLAQLFIRDGTMGKAKDVLRDAIDAADSDEDRFVAQNRLARVLQTEGNIQEAREIAQSILDVDANNSDALITRAAIMIGEEEYDDAIIDLRTVLKDRPDSVRALVLLGRAHNATNAPELANDYFTRAFQASEESSEVGIPLARFLAAQGDLERTEDTLLQIVRRNPENITAYQALAEVRLAREDWVGAEEAAQTLRRLKAKGSTIDLIEGASLFGQGEFARSIEAFEAAQSADPDSPRPMATLVNAYVQNNQTDKAEDFLESVLEASPENTFAHLLLADLYAKTGRPDEAEKLYVALLEDEPDQAVGYSSYLTFLIGQERLEDADKIVARGEERLPDNVAIGLMKGTILEMRGDYDAAIAHYARLHEKNPESTVISNNYASMLSEHRSDRESAEMALEVAKPLLSTNVPQFKDTLGWIHYRLGNFDRAASYLREAVDSAPDMAIIRYHLGMVYAANERPAAAIGELERALEQSRDDPLPMKADIEAKLEDLKAVLSSDDEEATGGEGSGNN